ncbi:MAG: DUF1540 domain-containing protein [Firmicutes bacterium]|nr:DUF1540 domain-containing protein [Bacillota bacterium]MBQ9973025.1 DUF1540 domain-containing protein [Bacillota bacterium]
MNSNYNSSIKCTVNSCKYNNTSKNYCTLSCVSIGTHEKNPSMDQCTDCLSFEK